MQVGDLRIDAVIDGTGRFPPTLSFRGTTDGQWAAHQDLLDADGLLGFSMGGFLIRGGSRTVLVDLGVGRRRVMGIQGGAFLAGLAGLGVAPGDVTDVLFTHLHLDHVGWAADDEGRPVFPAATYRCAAADWDHFMVGHPGEVSELLAGVTERFETWAGAGPVLAARTRAALSRELEDSGALIAAAHFPGLQFGRLLRASSGRRWLA